ncbi:MAG TPA: hypothetical protein VEK11_12070 [Thermoanaerobaculia bacterium]|nr:hypothetical protein [Thermoanaerobaculia bacterium]
MWCRTARVAAALAFLAAGVQLLPAGEAHVSLVPWKVLAPDDVVDAPLVLFWVPASPEDLRRSPLLTSDELTLYSSRCVAMRVVRVDDRARLARLDVGDEIPIAILTTREGALVGEVEGESGRLPVTEVEELVREELDRRAAEADALLDRARERAEANEVGAAIDLYERVWGERCTCPRQGKDARRALKKLGKK